MPQAAIATTQTNFVNREMRQQAGIPALLRRWRHVSLFELDVILLDVNASGIKLELNYDVRAGMGECFWLLLQPFDQESGTSVLSQAPIVLQAACRWYNPHTLTLGAAFKKIDRVSAQRLITMIDGLRRTGRGAV